MTVRVGPPNGRLMFVLIAGAIVIGIVVGYWIYSLF